MKTKKKKVTQSTMVKEGLKFIADDDSEREVNFTLCDDEDTYTLFSYNGKCSLILRQLNIDIIGGEVMPYYKLTPQQLIDFVKAYHSTPKDLVDPLTEIRRQSLMKARAAKGL